MGRPVQGEIKNNLVPFELLLCRNRQEPVGLEIIQ